MCTLYSFFSSRPSEVRLILKSPKCCTIQHKFVPARLVERNIEKIRFPWASNSKFVIFSQIFPRSNYKICPIIPRLFPVSNGDSPVSTTFPRSNYRGFFTTGESYCTMYTLCSGVLSDSGWLAQADHWPETLSKDPNRVFKFPRGKISNINIFISIHSANFVLHKLKHQFWVLSQSLKVSGRPQTAYHSQKAHQRRQLLRMPQGDSGGLGCYRA